MKKLFVANVLIALLVLAGAPAFADDLVSTLSNLKAPLVGRTTQGVIRSIDLEARTAVIGGYLYNFGPPTFPPVKVTLLNESTGSVEMLQPGMKVEVVYGDAGTLRVVASIKQLPDDTNVGM